MSLYTIAHKYGRLARLFLSVCNDCEVFLAVFLIKQLLHSRLLDVGWL